MPSGRISDRRDGGLRYDRAESLPTQVTLPSKHELQPKEIVNHSRLLIEGDVPRTVRHRLSKQVLPEEVHKRPNLRRELRTSRPQHAELVRLDHMVLKQRDQAAIANLVPDSEGRQAGDP